MNITGAIIRKLRLKDNVSLERLTNELNTEFDTRLSRGTLSRWENGKSVPGYTNLKILAKHFNVTTDFLRGVSNNNRPNMDIKSNTQQVIKKSPKAYAINRVIKILEDDKFTSNHIGLIKKYIEFLEYKIDNNMME